MLALGGGTFLSGCLVTESAAKVAGPHRAGVNFSETTKGEIESELARLGYAFVVRLDAPRRVTFGSDGETLLFHDCLLYFLLQPKY